MGRLIDADTIIDMIMNDGIYCDTDADKECSAQEIRELPTVDAIPREQINQAIKEMKEKYRGYWFQGSAGEIVDDFVDTLHKYTDKENKDGSNN